MNSRENLATELKQEEGLRLFAYDDANPNVPAIQLPCIQGTLTIGHGHTSGVEPGDVITADEAERLLYEDIDIAAEKVRRSVDRPLLPGQFWPLVGHAYNTGGSDTLFDEINKGILNLSKIGDWWTTTYTTAGGVYFSALAERRQSEFEVFNRSTKILRVVGAVSLLLAVLLILFFAFKPKK